jgi:hypothetical protein
MAGSNNLTPIQLQPNTNQSDTTAYLNENFRAISDALNPLRISDGSTNRILIGRYGQEQYGQVGYDSTGLRRILIGSAPDDGRIGIWVSKDGVDVITELGG